MVPQGSGNIVNISSGAIDTPAASSRARHDEGRGRDAHEDARSRSRSEGHRVNTLAPGVILTGFSRHDFVDDTGEVDEEKFQAYKKRFGAMAPLGRVGHTRGHRRRDPLSRVRRGVVRDRADHPAQRRRGDALVSATAGLSWCARPRGPRAPRRRCRRPRGRSRAPRCRARRSAGTHRNHREHVGRIGPLRAGTGGVTTCDRPATACRRRCTPPARPPRHELAREPPRLETGEHFEDGAVFARDRTGPSAAMRSVSPRIGTITPCSSSPYPSSTLVEASTPPRSRCHLIALRRQRIAFSCTESPRGSAHRRPWRHSTIHTMRSIRRKRAPPIWHPPSPTSASIPISSTPWPKAASTNPSPSRPSRSPTPSPVATSAARPRPARARRSPSVCRCCSAWAGRQRPPSASPRARAHPRAGRAGGHVLVPLAAARRLAVADVYGGASMDRADPGAAGGRRVVVGHARPAHRPDRRRASWWSTTSPTSWSTRPTAWPTWGSCPRCEWILRRVDSAASDAAVLGHPRRWHRPPRPPAPAGAGLPRGRRGRATVETMVHRFLLVHQMDKVQGGGGDRARGRARPDVRRTKRGADRLGPALGKEGVTARADPRRPAASAERERALADFSAGKVRVLVATDVAARGIHVDAVDVVVHYDPPEDHKAYLHRSGRTARAGDVGRRRHDGALQPGERRPSDPEAAPHRRAHRRSVLQRPASSRRARVEARRGRRHRVTPDRQLCSGSPSGSFR